MDKSKESAQVESGWKTRTLLIGTLVGALIGAGAAYLLVQNAARDEGQVKVSAGDGIKLGLLVLGLLRQVAQIGEGS